MRSTGIASVLLCTTSLVSAVPHARHPAHLLMHHHSHNVVPLAGRSTEYGACGGGAGSCGAGYCCSEWGYCGTTTDYCGSGCQSLFGTCGKDDSAVPNKVNQPAIVSNIAVVATAILAPLAPAYTGPLTTFPVMEPWQIISTSSAAAAASTFAALAPSLIISSNNAAAAASTSAPQATSATSGSSTGSEVAYKMYTGNGSLSEGWPAQSSWVDFDTMWNDNLPAMSTSCEQWGQAQNTEQNNNAIKSAIESQSASSGVDKRFILAIVMQESEGCVRVPTTFGSVSNPGLMQSHDGSGTCFDQAECPDSQIHQMIQDGTIGTPTVGLQECIAQAGTSDASKYYMAARIYNSGSIAPSGDLGQGVATHCYASDIANRLMGWVQSAATPRLCNL